MLATLSRWRSWVQIPSRTLIDKLTRYAIWQSGEAQTFVSCGFDSHPRHCIGSCSPRRPVKPLSENKWGGDERFNSFTTHSTRPVLLAVQDAGPSSRRRGFKSRTGHFSTTRPSGATGRHATLRTSCPDGLGSSNLPLVTAGGAGARLAFIRPECPDRYRDLQFD